MQLTTPRLILREIIEADWRPVLAYQSKPDYLKYYTWEKRTAADVQAFIRTFLAERKEDPRTRFQFAITLAGARQLIGICGLRQPKADSQEAEIGYEVDPAYWGHGYATEAALRLLDLGFADLQLHRIWAWCVADNSASVRVLQKLGLRHEGRLRENRWVKGRWRDTLIYGILRPEWEEQRR